MIHQKFICLCTYNVRPIVSATMPIAGPSMLEVSIGPSMIQSAISVEHWKSADITGIRSPSSAVEYIHVEYRQGSHRQPPEGQLDGQRACQVVGHPSGGEDRGGGDGAVPHSLPFRASRKFMVNSRPTTAGRLPLMPQPMALAGSAGGPAPAPAPSCCCCACCCA